LAYLNFDIHIGRPVLSFAFDTMHYGIWPFTGNGESGKDNEIEVSKLLL